MSGAGGGGGSATTYTGPPSWAVPTGINLLDAANSLVFQNGGLTPYPSNLNQQVAPLNPYQQAALGQAAGMTPTIQNLANQGALTNNAFAQGQFAGPNPFLNQYYNQAAQQDVMNYQMATQPALQAQFEQAGAFNSPGFQQAQGYAQYGLGQSLGTLGANIYEPAYQQGMQQMLQAGQMAPGLAQQLYGPQQELYTVGSALQQQNQQQLNANQQNAQQQVNWPFALLSQLGSAIGQATQGGGVSIAQNPGGGK